MPGSNLKDLATAALSNEKIPVPLLAKKIRRKNPERIALGKLLAPAITGCDLALSVQISVSALTGNNAECFLIVTSAEQEPRYYRLPASTDSKQHKIYLSIAQAANYELQAVAYLCAFGELRSRWQRLSQAFELEAQLWREQMNSLLERSESLLTEAAKQNSRPQLIRKRLRDLAAKMQSVELSANDFALRSPLATHSNKDLAEAINELFSDELSTEFSIRPLLGILEFINYLL